MHRRQFLYGASGIVAAAWAAPIVSAAPRLVARDLAFDRDPFTLGIASGDPTPDGIVLWTRLAPAPLEEGGGLPDAIVPVDWQVARDEQMQQVVRRGTAMAEPAWAHTVHVEVDGLDSDRWYWYQFSVGRGASRHLSTVGRTRTAPAPGAQVSRLAIGLASCQRWEDGYFTAYQHMAEEDLDLVVHVGDYIYEGKRKPGRVRAHPDEEAVTLAQYRLRYALYKGDPHLQRVHARFPWIVTPDDHEVADNYAADAAAEDAAVQGAAFIARRTAAYQAYYEHMPLRRAARPSGSHIRLHRTLTFGQLATFHVLDTRQYRNDQPCGDGQKPSCPERVLASRTMLGSSQEQWLFQNLRRSGARWNLLAQQIILAEIDLDPGPDEVFMLDKWDGYPAARRRLLDFLATARPSNPIVLTGDNHNHWVFDLKRDFRDERSPVVATEFVGTSISSGADGSEQAPELARALSANPHARYLNSRRGYVSLRVQADRLQADYRVVPYITRPDAPLTTPASFIVESGQAGAQRT